MEAFLKARGKNHAEDVRLQQILATFELEKKQWERRVFNETFEQRNLAFSMKKNADEIKHKKKTRKPNKSKPEYDEGGNATKSGLPPLEGKVPCADPPGGSPQVRPNTQPFPVVQQTPQTLRIKVTNTPRTHLPGLAKDESKGRGTVIITGKTRFARAVEAVMTKQREDGPKLPKTEYPRVGFSDTANKRIDLAELVARLFPKTLRRAHSMADLELLKEGPLTQRSQDEEDNNDIFKPGEEESTEEIDPFPSKGEFWIGDPKAIGSVRRPRLPPEMMSARSKNVGEVMKMIRDLPVYPSCSRNCNKPGASFEDFPDEQKNMMPSMVIANVARHYLKTSRATSLEAISSTRDTSQVVPFPAIMDSTLAAPTVQKKIEQSMADKLQSLKRSQRELTRNTRNNTVVRPSLEKATTSLETS